MFHYLQKQHNFVEYLGCLLDNTLSGKDMAEKVLEKVNGRLKCLYRQSKYLNKRLRRMPCNTIIQPHFDYASSAWYPNLNKNLSPSSKLLKINAFRFAYTLKIGRVYATNISRK